MSLDVQFYVQRLVNGGWETPPEFRSSSCRHPSDRTCIWCRTGLAVWCTRWPLFMELFHPPVDLFSWQVSRPPWIADSGLFRWLGGGEHAERVIEEYWRFWLPAADLLLDRWDDHFVLVSTVVEARYQELFGDGEQPFPEAGLAASGMAAEAIAELRRYEGDYAQLGPARIGYEPARPGASTLDGQPRVSWSVTVSELVGRHVEDFRSILGYGPIADLRVICLCS